jgi:alpha-glucosidase
VGDLPGITARLPYLAWSGGGCVWLSPFFRSPMKDMGYDVSDYCDVDPVFGTLADFDALVARAHDLGLKVIIDQVLSHSSDRTRSLPKAAPAGRAREGRLVCLGRSAPRRHAAQQLAVGLRRQRLDLGRPAQAVLPAQLPDLEQPDLNYHNPAVQDWALSVLRFWLDRGVDGFRFDTVNYFFHDRLCATIRPTTARRTEPEANPYGMQYHLFDKNRPENLAWLARIRGCWTNTARPRWARWATATTPSEMMGAYTAPGRLHQCYSFEMLGDDYAPAFFRDRIEGFFGARRRAGRCGPLATTTCRGT